MHVPYLMTVGAITRGLWWPRFLIGMALLAGMTSLSAIGEGEAGEIARRALEELRDDDERKLTTLIVPEAGSARGWEKGGEVYVIRGYINYDCLRFFMQEGRTKAQRVKMTRTWFYSPKEGYSTEEWDIPNEEAALAWEAALLIGQSRLVRKDLGEPRHSKKWSTTVASSSHEPTFYVWGQSQEGIWWDQAVRGRSRTNGVQDFDKLQTRALVAIWEGLVPDKPPVNEFPLADWGGFLTKRLAENLEVLKNPPNRLDRSTELVVETSLRLLGQMGYVPAREVIVEVQNAVQKMPHTPWSKSIQNEVTYALQKIAVQEKFDAGEVARLIQESGRRLNSDRDMVKWLRGQYFANDPEGYFALLTRDMTDKETPESVLLEGIEDVQTHYAKNGRDLLTGVLANPSSEVVVGAALALLKEDGNNEGALLALTQVAEDPAATISPQARWHSHFGRERALDYLASARSPVSAKYRWDIPRIERQLAKPWEDGRVIKKLITLWWILNNKEMPETLQIQAYRKALAKPYNLGTLDACQELIKLKDKASAMKMQKLLEILRSGCNKNPPWEDDSEAKYPQIRAFDLESLENKLSVLIP